MLKKTFKFRIYPSKAQTTQLELTLNLCRELYNSALQERRDAWRFNQINITNQDQEKQLPEIKKIRTDLNEVYSQVLQEVLKRVDRSFQNFFHKVKLKQSTGGFPRFQNKSRYKSFTFKQSGFSLLQGRLNLSKIGKVKIKLHRQIIGKVKTLTISRDSTGKWFACFAIETQTQKLAPTNKTVGIDCGISKFAVLSDGFEVDNPRFFRQEEKQIAKAQRKLSLEKKGTKERFEKRKIIAKIHQRNRNKRNNFAHQFSNHLVKNYDRIFFEDLNIKGMMKNRCLAKAIGDVAWKQTIQLTQNKAAEAGRVVELVDPRNTSQQCSKCGEIVKKDLSVRLHHCIKCGLKICRDLNAAINIKTLGLKSLGL
ncbi:MAG TPA: transposase [Pyrinomonadaceae bacterium]|nr:transposase [Pyrinomonadaceae bacterium]